MLVSHIDSLHAHFASFPTKPDPFVHCLRYVRIKFMAFRLILHLARLECIAAPSFSSLSARRTSLAGRLEPMCSHCIYLYFVLHHSTREVFVRAICVPWLVSDRAQSFSC